jgi:hypothetical protein
VSLSPDQTIIKAASATLRQRATVATDQGNLSITLYCLLAAAFVDMAARELALYEKPAEST